MAFKDINTFNKDELFNTNSFNTRIDDVNINFKETAREINSVNLEISNAEDRITALENKPAPEGVPSGTIVMWNGNTIPSGWASCDGTNGTPDLRNKFVISAGNRYSKGSTGGAETHTLTVGQTPSHTHTVNSNVLQNGTHRHDVYLRPSATGTGFGIFSKIGSPTTSGSTYLTLQTKSWDSESWVLDAIAAGLHNHSVSNSVSSVGSGQSHNNMPPYYALIYIMKL